MNPIVCVYTPPMIGPVGICAVRWQDARGDLHEGRGLVLDGAVVYEAPGLWPMPVAQPLEWPLVVWEAVAGILPDAREA